VTAWREERDAVVVETTRGRYRSRRLVVSGGAWSSQLLRDLGVELIVTRQVLGWVWPRNPDQFRLGTLPVWMIDRLDGSVYYGFPMITLSPGLKVALHAPLQPTDPNRVVRDILPGDEETFRAGLRSYVPSANGPLLALRTCLYTNTPDGHFILGQHPRHEKVFVAAGFSGHGFKFASVIGEALADLAHTGTTALPIEFLRPQRFA
jgi:sarcosine oxidase